MTDEITYTGMDGVSVHDSEFVTLFAGDEEIVAQRAKAAIPDEAGDPLFPEMAWRISATGEPGELQVGRAMVWFAALPSAPDEGPFIWPAILTVTVPEESDGAIYIVFTYYPSALSLEYSATPLTPGANRYVRALANVSRGTGDAVTFSQRHIGILTVPSQMTFSQFL